MPASSPSTPPHPFLYVAAWRRSGSKLLARGLTRWPTSYVFLEPGIAIPTMRAKPEPTTLLAEFGIDLSAAAAMVQSLPSDQRPAAVVRTVLAPLRRKVPVVGVKEIRHQAADLALEALGPDTRIVVLVRDPRGVLDSLRRKEAWRDRPIELPGGLGPASLADHLREQFVAQQRLIETHPSCVVRYEDLCERPRLIESIRRFCGLPADLDADLDRLDGHEIGARGDRIVPDASERWRQDQAHAAEYDEIHDRLADVCRYWGYGKDGHRTPEPPGPPASAVLSAPDAASST